MFTVVRTENEINRVQNWADEGSNEGSRYPGMSYEQGIIDALSWLCGDDDKSSKRETAQPWAVCRARERRY